jgi:hypothetical protein
MAVQIVGFGGFPQEHLLQHVFELADDDAAAHYVGRELHEVLAAREGAGGYWVGPDGEVQLPVRVIDDAAL